MHERRFSHWARWSVRDQLADLSEPGVYVIAMSSSPLSGAGFSWSPRIIYIGMTNAKAGLKSRLRQFDATMVGTLRHGGADRVRYKYRDYANFARRCWIAVAAFPCDPTSNRPADLRVMGEVARFEYECLAHFVERFGQLPKFNDKSGSPKFSHTIGRSPKPVNRSLRG